MKFTDKLFDDLSPEARYDALQNAAYKQEKDMVKRQFTPEQLEGYQRELSTNTIAIDGQETLIAEFCAPIREEIKNLKGVKKELIKKVKLGYEQNEEETFMFDDQKNGLMYIYDADGELLSSRKLTRKEKQTSIHQLKSGTNG